MKKVYYYVGANNITKTLESDKIIKTISEHFDGFTAFEVVGFWKGSQEKTLKIEVITDLIDSKLAGIARELKEKLEQDSVLMEIVQSNCAFIN